MMLKSNLKLIICCFNGTNKMKYCVIFCAKVQMCNHMEIKQSNSLQYSDLLSCNVISLVGKHLCLCPRIEEIIIVFIIYSMRKFAHF